MKFMSLELILAGLSVFISLVLSFLLFKLYRHYTKLTSNVSQKDLITSLNRLISVSELNTEKISDLSEKLDAEISQNKKHIQRVGFSRYNPFTDTGGDQSFSLSLLDENGDGVVISSLHSRENTRLYAKKVELGKVQDQALSKEEQSVIKEALK